MTQLEIQFFWPLTEQIPLDLDYINCHKEPVYTNPMLISNSLLVSNGGTTGIIQPSIQFDLDNLKPIIKQIDMPWYRKLAFKVLGFKVNK